MPKTLQAKLNPITGSQGVAASEMEVGDLAQVLEKNQHNLRFLLRTFEGWVDLERPTNTWSNKNLGPDWRVRILSAGESITLTV